MTQKPGSVAGFFDFDLIFSVPVSYVFEPTFEKVGYECFWRCVYDSLGVDFLCLAHCNSLGSIYLPLWPFFHSSFGDFFT